MPQATVEAMTSCPASPRWGHPILYGPVQSRRLGFSLGLDLLPAEDKTCNFDCLYCECGWTPWIKAPKPWFPSLDTIEEAVSQGLPVMARLHPSIDVITFSGHGEPTLFPEFPEAVDLVRGLASRYLPWTRLAILTNGTMLDDRSVFDAVGHFDIKCVKLDAGGAWLNRPRLGIDISALLPVWKELPHLIIQSFFCEGRFDNTRREWVDPWLEQVKAVNPRCVQLYTLDRSPAVAVMQKASLSTLKSIGRRLASEVGSEVQIFE